MNSDQPNVEVLLDQLHTALFNNDSAAVRALVESGVDPSVEFLVCKVTALELATLHGRAEIVDTLLDCGARVPEDALLAIGEMDVTDYMIESDEDELRYYLVAKALLARGASPAVKAYDGTLLTEYFPENFYPRLHRLFADAMNR